MIRWDLSRIRQINLVVLSLLRQIKGIAICPKEVMHPLNGASPFRIRTDVQALDAQQRLSFLPV